MRAIPPLQPRLAAWAASRSAGRRFLLQARAASTSEMGKVKGAQRPANSQKPHYSSYVQVRRAAYFAGRRAARRCNIAAARMRGKPVCKGGPVTASPAHTPRGRPPQVLNCDNATAAPSVLLAFDSERFLFNCGEGFQRLALESKVAPAQQRGAQCAQAARQPAPPPLPAGPRPHALPIAAPHPPLRPPPQVRIARIKSVLATRACTDTLAGLPGLLLTLAPAGPDHPNHDGALDAGPLRAQLVGECPQSARRRRHAAPGALASPRGAYQL